MKPSNKPGIDPSAPIMQHVKDALRGGQVLGVFQP